MKDFLRSAETVLIPKGDDNRASVRAFEQTADIEVPTFTDEKLWVESEGRTFWLVKGKDVPELISKGVGDIGITGTDSMKESKAKGLRAKRLGEDIMCRFSLLANELGLAYWRRGLDGGSMPYGTESLDVLTARPRLVTKLSRSTGLIMRPIDLSISGSVEGILRLIEDRTARPLAADIVDSGETARQNGVYEVRKLMDIYPEVVFRDQLDGTI